MIRQPPRSPLFPSTTLFRPLDRELERRALLGQRLEVHARVADRRHAGLADRALVPARERAAHGLVEHGLAADALEHRSESTRLNSSHANISYAVFCLKNKKN